MSIGGRRRSTLIKPLSDFLKAEAAGGVVVVLAALGALVWANSPWSGSYVALWSTEIGARIGTFAFKLDLRHWVNDGLMTIFFFVVGLEIKREFVEGELREPRKAVAPVAGAIGGMVLPALIYVAWTGGTPEAKGWGIPMATDIALAVGLLTLGGSRIPSGAKLFLLALAIVDDIGAIVVIALFYGSGGRPALILASAGVVVCVLILRRLGVRSFGVYIGLGVVLWWTLQEAGVHATIAGAIMGVLAPVRPLLREDLIDVDELADLTTVEHAVASMQIVRSSVSVVEWLEHKLHSWTSFAVVPIFALANAGVALSVSSLGDSFRAPITWGIVFGLVLGKPVGIMFATWLVVRNGIGSLPDDTNWRALLPAAIVAGVGFTVSLLVTELAVSPPATDQAKVGVIIASVVAGVLALTFAFRSPERPPLNH